MLPSFQATRSLHKLVSAVITGPSALAFLPAISLGAFWFGGEGTLIAVSVILPLACLLSGGLTHTLQSSRNSVSGLYNRTAFEDLVKNSCARLRADGRQSALFFVALEDFDCVIERYGQAAADQIIKRTGERLLSQLREDDIVGQMGDDRFAICTAAVRQLDLEDCIQTAARLQTTLEDAFVIDGSAVYLSASIGFCQSDRAAGRGSEYWLQAAAMALRAAQKNGPSAIRAFSDEMRRETQNHAALLEEVGHALDCGQIRPWFQPQISTDTGEITGFEALARWSHPSRGMISPAEFLPIVEQAGLLERLAEVMMYNAFSALKAWEDGGVIIPHVGVNFAGSELNNPNLIDKIKWELDRFDLSPERLAVEVLETVVAGAPDDVVTRNIAGLCALGCRIDLDDFGTGHASLSSIQRFAVNRIKIDRSFVMKADRDPEQQRMIAAILTMAERLEVETLAEGVESVGEHVLLAQLGCDHVQGFGIAHPMPFEDTLDWIAGHNAKLADVPQIMGGRAG